MKGPSPHFLIPVFFGPPSLEYHPRTPCPRTSTTILVDIIPVSVQMEKGRIGSPGGVPKIMLVFVLTKF